MPSSVLPGWHLPNGSQLAGFVGTIAFHSVAISINPPEPGYRVNRDPRRVLWYTEGRITTICTHTPALHAHWSYTATPYPTPSLPIPFVFLFLFQAFLPAHHTVTWRKSSVCTSPCRWCICKVKIPQVAFSLFISDPSQPAWFSGKGPGRYK